MFKYITSLLILSIICISVPMCVRVCERACGGEGVKYHYAKGFLFP